MNTKFFDVIVVGAGHAGVEAAHAAANMGAKTALVTLKKEKIGYMPCNPAIGGIGKGHIVFEVSALGGLMPKLCTKTYLQARMLNTKKGPAVHGLRVQIDKVAYAQESQKVLAQIKNLTIIEAMVDELIIEKETIKGVVLNDGTDLFAPSVVLTTGTFLNGLAHIGLKNYGSGREDEPPVTKLAQNLRSLGLKMGRLKTGTPPRLLRSSLDFTKMEKQEADNLGYLFEFWPHKTTTKKECYITATNEQAHNIIKNNADKSPIFTKEILSRGPRYCPSIEDKVTRFAEKKSHQIFIEQESLATELMYPTGISTSLPLEVQEEFIRSIKGFENAVIARPGYCIEYDFFLPDQLAHTLEVKAIQGLFFAGQLNGTTGYEEAAGQGIVAGINAALKVQNKEPFILGRTESYIGVMIDDLVTLGVDEPYRMFTSRAERRLLLRQDNAFLRLTEKGYQLGLVDETMYQAFKEEKQEMEAVLEQLKKEHPNTQLLDLFQESDKAEQTIFELTGKKLPARNCQTIQANIKYGPYLEREEKEAEKIKKQQNMKLPDNLDYFSCEGLSMELRHKLTEHKPATIAQAQLIRGMTPAALSFLLLKVASTRP